LVGWHLVVMIWIGYSSFTTVAFWCSTCTTDGKLCKMSLKKAQVVFSEWKAVRVTPYRRRKNFTKNSQKYCVNLPKILTNNFFRVKCHKTTQQNTINTDVTFGLLLFVSDKKRLSGCLDISTASAASESEIQIFMPFGTRHQRIMESLD